MEGIETINIEELKEGNSLFQSRGHSLLKVTHDGQEKRLRIPIKSTGVTELMEEMRAKAPKPPVINKVIHPDDPAFKELGLSRKQHVKTFDLTDESYIEATEKHNQEIGIKLMLKGIDVPIKDKEGNIVEDRDKKMTILRDMGLTAPHFTQIIRDITSLTEWQEAEENDFLQD